MEQDKQEICTIRIIFPVKSDDQALAYKKKMSEVISDIPDAQMDFRIMSGRPSPPGM